VHIEHRIFASHNYVGHQIQPHILIQIDAGCLSGTGNATSIRHIYILIVDDYRSTKISAYKPALSLNYVVELGNEDSPLDRDMIRVRNRALEYLGFPEKANDRAM
jgi:hypothetical protein